MLQPALRERSRPARPGEHGFLSTQPSIDHGYRGRESTMYGIRTSPATTRPDVRHGMKWRLHTPHAAGWNNAYDANGRRGITDKIVRLSFAGCRDDEVPESDPPRTERVLVYVFVHETLEPDGFLPPHDHRSNEPQHGGFAFACYAPRTALPQMPWHI